jgi:hypothetical protein
VSDPKECCDSCRFWERGLDKGVGFCCRYPPTVVVFGGVVSKGEEAAEVWPETLSIDWCGEWEAKREAQE